MQLVYLLFDQFIETQAEVGNKKVSYEYCHKEWVEVRLMLKTALLIIYR